MSITLAKPITPASATAIYCRISEDDEKDRKGVERQLADCTALVKRNGWTLVGVPFIDNDISAFSGKMRPAYSAMLAKVKAGEVRRVVCWHMDRLYRRPRELEDIIDLAEAGQLEVACVNGSRYDLSDSDGQLNARMLVSVARKSSQDTARRQKSKQQELRAAGMSTGGPRPFGWQKGAGRGTLVPHPSESKLLLKAMDDVLAGASLNDVARLWTTSKVRNRSWGSNDVNRALTMPRHAGLVVHRGEIVGTGRWKPLLPRARWEQVCAAVSGRSRFSGLPRRRSMLTGIFVCGSCGAQMVRSSGVNGVKLWRCHEGPRRSGCGKVSIRADLVEPIIVAATIQYVDNLDLAALLTEQDPHAPDLAKVAKQLADLDKREDEAGRSHAAGRITVRGFEATTSAIQKQRQTLQSGLARQANRNALSAFAGRPGALRAAWATLTTDQQRTIIGESLGKVAILPTPTKGARFDPTRIIIGEPSPAAARR